jgi:hypothetical protein
MLRLPTLKAVKRGVLDRAGKRKAAPAAEKPEPSTLRSVRRVRWMSPRLAPLRCSCVSKGVCFSPSRRCCAPSKPSSWPKKSWPLRTRKRFSAFTRSDVINGVCCALRPSVLRRQVLCWHTQGPALSTGEYVEDPLRKSRKNPHL